MNNEQNVEKYCIKVFYFLYLFFKISFSITINIKQM